MYIFILIFVLFSICFTICYYAYRLLKRIIRSFIPKPNNQKHINQTKSKYEYNPLIEPFDNKQTNTLPTDEQIRALATLGHKTDWLYDVTNGNLFQIMFEWIQIGDHKKRLKYKSLKSNRINYAPHFISYTDENKFYYNGDWTTNRICLSCFSIGDVDIEYPSKCMVRLIAPHTLFLENKNGIQLEDNSDVLEIDYSPEAIEYGENQIRNIIRKEAQERHEQELNKTKARIKERKNKRELEKQALQELIEEGIIFPESNKRPPIPRDVVDAVWNRDNGKCVYCGSTNNIHLDHIIPFSKGGATNIENLQLLCQKCNLEKSNKIG